jgi:hypothetical protein
LKDKTFDCLRYIVDDYEIIKKEGETRWQKVKH